MAELENEVVEQETTSATSKDSFWERKFELKKKGSNFKTEVVAGIVTFLAMCYILTVNPNQIFYAGTGDARWSSLFLATAFGAVIGTLLMALFAKMPLAQHWAVLL